MVSHAPSIESGHTYFHIFPQTSKAEWSDSPIRPNCTIHLLRLFAFNRLRSYLLLKTMPSSSATRSFKTSFLMTSGDDRQGPAITISNTSACSTPVNDVNAATAAPNSKKNMNVPLELKRALNANNYTWSLEHRSAQPQTTDVTKTTKTRALLSSRYYGSSLHCLLLRRNSDCEEA